MRSCEWEIIVEGAIVARACSKCRENIYRIERWYRRARCNALCCTAGAAMHSSLPLALRRAV